MDGRDVMVMAHRGCWEGGAPEVSVAAIRACEAIGPDMIEIDVRQTRDGRLILMHDETVDRMTNGKGAIADMNWADLRRLRLRVGGGGPEAALTRERIPTLEDGLKAAKGKFIVHLHLYTKAEEEIVATVRKQGMGGQVTTWISSPPDGRPLLGSPMLGTIGLMPIVKECPTSPTPGCWSAPMRALAGAPFDQAAGFYIIPQGSIASETAHSFFREAVPSLRPASSRLMASTLFDVDQRPLPVLHAEWGKLINLGIDLIMTDHPGALIDFLRKEKRR
jgi:glycerophosphoryl diester phosphodiesterase